MAKVLTLTKDGIERMVFQAEQKWEADLADLYLDEMEPMVYTDNGDEDRWNAFASHYDVLTENFV